MISKPHAMRNDSLEKEIITTRIWNAFQRHVFGKNKTKCAARTSKLSSDDIPFLTKTHNDQQIQVTGCIICNDTIPIKLFPNSSGIVRNSHPLDSMLDVRHQRIQL